LSLVYAVIFRAEIAISCWDSEDQIAAWKRDPEHRAAQREGRAKWYSSYTVEVARVERGYSNPVSLEASPDG
jgi:heme-degrading monooxygenase HmoA